MLLTFGLLSPNKGIEHVLNALPQIVAEFPERRLHRAGRDASERIARTGRGLPPEPRTARQEEQSAEERHFLQPLCRTGGTQGISSARRTFTSRLISTKRRSPRARWPMRLARARPSSRRPTGTRRNCWPRTAACSCRSATPRRLRARSRSCLRDDTRRHAMRKNAYKLGREMIWSNVAEAVFAARSSRRGWRERAGRGSRLPPRRSTSSRANCRSSSWIILRA